MKKKIFYWSPCLNPVGTIISTMNSAISANEYGNKNYDVTIIDACGEWKNYEKYLVKNRVKVLSLNFNFYNLLPKRGYFQSRFSYIIIFLTCFFPLIKILNKEKPDILIAHLITSLPLTIMNLTNISTKFILRISGMPKINFLRKYFWKYSSKKLHLVTCPSLELKSKLENLKIFYDKSLFFLPDAVINVKNFLSQKNQEIKFPINVIDKKIIFAAGRLTKQKNFSYLIDEFYNFSLINQKYVLFILGEGELKKELLKQIKKLKLENKVFLIGHVKNIYSYFLKGEIFILSSLWEEMGFVMIEAALSNLFVIASDCPNGPKEFLNEGKNGLLFRSNSQNSLSEQLNVYQTIQNKKKFKINLKKEVCKFTKFRHFKKLDSILKKI